MKFDWVLTLTRFNKSAFTNNLKIKPTGSLEFFRTAIANGNMTQLCYIQASFCNADTENMLDANHVNNR